MTAIADENDPGATVTNPGGNGLSLREALALANGNGATPDTITFAAGLSGGQIYLSNGQLSITTDGITINGDINGDGKADITISANHSSSTQDANSRILTIDNANASTISTTLNGLILRDGKSVSTGGAILMGVGESLRLTNSSILNNQGTVGGGIYGNANNAIEVVNSTIDGNTASNGRGGGIQTLAGSLITLFGSTVSNNYASRFGGGLAGRATSITLVDSTIFGNASGSTGGGIYNRQGPVTLINSTVTGNDAINAPQRGGGIYDYRGGAVITLVNSIVAGNRAGGNFGSGTPPASPTDGNDLTGSVNYGGGGPDSGHLLLVGNNIIGSTPFHMQSITGSTSTLTQIDGTNQAALATVFASVALVDPRGAGPAFLAGVLANNGGPVKTVAIKQGGIAHNTGDDTKAVYDHDRNTSTADIPIPTDARGFARHSGAHVDIGAFEISQARFDFNADSRGDILFQHDNGALGIWLLNGTSTQLISGAIPHPGAGWHAKDYADFNGDGKADIIWQHDNGTAAVWTFDGFNLTGSGPPLPNPGPTWHVISAADFNGNGKADILWQHDSGALAVWLMNGVNVEASSPGIPHPGAGWHAKDAADFNGDGKADILWQHDNGTPAVWLMDGMTPIGFGPPLPNSDPAWHIIAGADFNGDGKADILFQHDNGALGIWLMNGTTVGTFSGAIPHPGAGWHVKEATDTNGDGKADIIWQHDNGTPAVWLFDGVTPTSFGPALPNPGTAWHII